MARTIVAAAVALVLGIFVGSLGPRAELRRVEQRLEEAWGSSSG